MSKRWHTQKVLVPRVQSCWMIGENTTGRIAEDMMPIYIISLCGKERSSDPHTGCMKISPPRQRLSRPKPSTKSYPCYPRIEQRVEYDTCKKWQRQQHAAQIISALSRSIVKTKSLRHSSLILHWLVPCQSRRFAPMSKIRSLIRGSWRLVHTNPAL